MSATTIRVYTIGQTPRPDLTDELVERVDGWPVEVIGALDDLPAAEIPGCPADGYPLETRMRDGTRVVVGAAFLESRLQEAIAQRDDSAAIHFVLCAGVFPGLTARGPLIQPFEAAALALSGGGLRALDVVVPFAAQTAASLAKWRTAGFSARVHSLDQKGEDVSAGRWLSGRLTGPTRDAVVFDYVGYPATILHEAAAHVGLPIFDVGRLAMDALDRELAQRKEAPR